MTVTELRDALNKQIEKGRGQALVELQSLPYRQQGPQLIARIDVPRAQSPNRVRFITT